MSVCVFIDSICHILYYFNLKQQIWSIWTGQCLYNVSQFCYEIERKTEHCSRPLNSCEFQNWQNTYELDHIPWFADIVLFVFDTSQTDLKHLPTYSCIQRTHSQRFNSLATEAVPQWWCQCHYLPGSKYIMAITTILEKKSCWNT